MKKLLIFLSVIFLCGLSQAFAQSVTDGDCNQCHVKQSSSAEKAGTLSFVHAQKNLKNCMVCHKKSDLEAKHVNVKPGEKKFVMAKRYNADFCQPCHGTLQDVANRTRDSKALTDTAGRSVNPHAIPAVEQHEKLVQCNMCHRVHKQQPDTRKTCTGCHHTGQYVCTGCHDQK